MIVDRDSWETPKDLWALLNSQYRFTFDCCASNDNKKTDRYSDNFEEVRFCKDNSEILWLNPPFSKAFSMFEHFFFFGDRGVSIYRCDNMETKVWQELILSKASWIWIPQGRISYKGQKGTGARFPSAIIGYNVALPILAGGTIIKLR